jgi:hypothetical protein
VHSAIFQKRNDRLATASPSIGSVLLGLLLLLIRQRAALPLGAAAASLPGTLLFQPVRTWHSIIAIASSEPTLCLEAIKKATSFGSLCLGGSSLARWCRFWCRSRFRHGGCLGHRLWHRHALGHDELLSVLGALAVHRALLLLGCLAVAVDPTGPTLRRREIPPTRDVPR